MNIINSILSISSGDFNIVNKAAVFQKYVSQGVRSTYTSPVPDIVPEQAPEIPEVPEEIPEVPQLPQDIDIPEIPELPKDIIEVSITTLKTSPRFPFKSPGLDFNAPKKIQKKKIFSPITPDFAEQSESPKKYFTPIEPEEIIEPEDTLDFDTRNKLFPVVTIEPIKMTPPKKPPIQSTNDYLSPVKSGLSKDSPIKSGPLDRQTLIDKLKMSIENNTLEDKKKSLVPMSNKDMVNYIEIITGSGKGLQGKLKKELLAMLKAAVLKT